MIFSIGDMVDLELRQHTRHRRDNSPGYVEQPPIYRQARIVAIRGGLYVVEFSTPTGLSRKSVPIEKIKRIT